MKKFLCVLLALALVCSLGVSALAVGSPTKDEADEDVTAALPAVAPETVEVTKEDGTTEEALGFALCDAETDAVKGVVPADALELTALDDADDLDDEDAEKFLEEFEKVKALEDKVVKYFFWLDVPEEYEINGENYLKFVFKCKGENVEVTVDGEPMEVVEVEGEADTYFAKLTKTGAVAITCDAE